MVSCDNEQFMKIHSEFIQGGEIKGHVMYQGNVYDKFDISADHKYLLRKKELVNINKYIDLYTTKNRLEQDLNSRIKIQVDSAFEKIKKVSSVCGVIQTLESVPVTAVVGLKAPADEQEVVDYFLEKKIAGLKGRLIEKYDPEWYVDFIKRCKGKIPTELKFKQIFNQQGIYQLKRGIVGSKEEWKNPKPVLKDKVRGPNSDPAWVSPRVEIVGQLHPIKLDSPNDIVYLPHGNREPTIMRHKNKRDRWYVGCEHLKKTFEPVFDKMQMRIEAKIKYAKRFDKYIEVNKKDKLYSDIKSDDLFMLNCADPNLYKSYLPIMGKRKFKKNRFVKSGSRSLYIFESKY
jgi:hypothetical protein